MSNRGDSTPLAVVFGCAGTVLTDAERAFFRDAAPAGFILFARNVDGPEQVRALVDELRGTLDRPDAPVLIDQEGGRVARLGPPHWPVFPAAAQFGELAARNMDAAVEAASLNARRIATVLRPLGINVDCLPLLDLCLPGAHDIIGDRAYSGDPDVVAALGRACCEGLLQGGVLPVIKHIPGHGRAQTDTHVSLPIVDTPHRELANTDFRPFRALAGMPAAMTAHIVYRALDDSAPATTSTPVVSDIIRGELGFQGLLFSDDIGMKALGGPFADRARAALDAGCDLVLHCSGDMAEMVDTAAGGVKMTDTGRRRLDAALQCIAAPAPVDVAEAEQRVKEIFSEFNVLLTA